MSRGCVGEQSWSSDFSRVKRIVDGLRVHFVWDGSCVGPAPSPVKSGQSCLNQDFQDLRMNRISDTLALWERAGVRESFNRHP